MYRNRKAKIIATLGPASAELAVIQSLFHNGADVFRLNFSHGTRETHRRYIEHIRAVEQEVHRPIGILLDLQGPRFRLGEIAEGAMLIEEGQMFRFDREAAIPGSSQRVPMPFAEFFAALKRHRVILADDGRVRLLVDDCGEDFADVRVIKGHGVLATRRCLAIQGAPVPTPAFTEKDCADLEYGLELGIDWVALPHVQRPQDLLELKRVCNKRAKIIAKIDSSAALANLDAIIAVSDAVMLARGDLGFDTEPEDFPGIQKQVVRAARKAGKPVIVATQMLDSMATSPIPSRAEASDVATAIYDGADALMLTTETASGKHPVDAVQVMSRIITRTEFGNHYREVLSTSHPTSWATKADAIGTAAQNIAELLDAAAIVAYTSSGSSAFSMARERPRKPIIGITPSIAAARQLALVWGVHAIDCPEATDEAKMTELACQIARDENFAGRGKSIIISAGVPFGKAGSTNMLRIAEVD
ncbi:MAG TPA: pyruvate kinase [Azonexus sp.]|nr:pyruvate kinase [Azonexus sp.]